MKPKRNLVLPTVGVAAACIAIFGFSNFSDRDDVVYCVDGEDKVVDEAKCDDTTQYYSSAGSSNFWYMIGRYAPNQPIGTRLDPTIASQRIPFNDPYARSQAGLASTGKVGTGKSIAGKSGGFGSGSSSSQDGFGG